MEVIGGGRYEMFDERLGSPGATASVVAGRHIALNRPVAIKILAGHLAEDPVFTERFVAEGQAQSRIVNPFVVTVYDADRLRDGRPYIVMERLDGGTFLSFAREAAEGPPPLSVTAPLLAQAALGIAAAHDKGLVHRDVKPANLLLDGVGGLKVADFGIAKEVLADEGLTADGRVIGTLGFLSAPRMHGEKAVFDDDVFALAVVAYMALTGREPFPTKSLVAAWTAMSAQRYLACADAQASTPQEVEELVDHVLRTGAKTTRAPLDVTAGQFADVFLNACPSAQLQRRLRPRLTGDASGIAVGGSTTATVVATAIQTLPLKQREGNSFASDLRAGMQELLTSAWILLGVLAVLLGVALAVTCLFVLFALLTGTAALVDIAFRTAGGAAVVVFFFAALERRQRERREAVNGRRHRPLLPSGLRGRVLNWLATIAAVTITLNSFLVIAGLINYSPTWDKLGHIVVRLIVVVLVLYGAGLWGLRPRVDAGAGADVLLTRTWWGFGCAATLLCAIAVAKVASPGVAIVVGLVVALAFGLSERRVRHLLAEAPTSIAHAIDPSRDRPDGGRPDVTGSSTTRRGIRTRRAGRGPRSVGEPARGGDAARAEQRRLNVTQKPRAGHLNAPTVSPRVGSVSKSSYEFRRMYRRIVVAVHFLVGTVAFGGAGLLAAKTFERLL